MKVYLAAPYAARADMALEAMVLQAHGHIITSRWIWATHPIEPGTVDAAPAHSDYHLRYQTAQDLEDIDGADAVILFTSSWTMETYNLHRHQTISGGRHVEVGYALAKKKLVIVLGDPENIFHRGACAIAGNWDEVLHLLSDDRAGDLIHLNRNNDETDEGAHNGS